VNRSILEVKDRVQCKLLAVGDVGRPARASPDEGGVRQGRGKIIVSAHDNEEASECDHWFRMGE
jgi:hypothetical protein